MPETINKFYSDLDDVVEKIDWERIRNTMVFLGWKWAKFSESRVPSIEELKSAAIDLGWIAISEFKNNPHHEYYSASSGGIHVYIHKLRLSDSYAITVTFELQSKSS